MKKLFVLLVALLLPAWVGAAEEPERAEPALVLALVSAILPEYELAEGVTMDGGETMLLLMRRPDGEKVLICGRLDPEAGWQWTESTPLPGDAHIGYSNFADSIALYEKRWLVRIGLFADGTWGITQLYTPEKSLFPLGQNWINEPMMEAMPGDHPWSDITRVDWQALPVNLDEAAAGLDTSQWARIRANANLYTLPDEEAAVLGTYYTGAPVRVLETDGSWTKADILGLEGWLRSDVLALGTDMAKVTYQGPWLSTVGSGAMMHEQPLADSPCQFVLDNSWTSSFYVVGCHEDWFHVWCVQDGSGGYIHRDDLWEGNG